MVFSVVILRIDWKKSYKILTRDRNNTESSNAGWTMSAMAGAFRVQLEKPGHYVIGDENILTPQHITKALQIMTISSLLFVILIICPLLILMLTLV